ISLFNDTAQWGASINDADNPFSGGMAYYGGAARPNSDLRFRVLPGSNVQPVPEPSTMLLLGSGLIGLVVYRKKRQG
ncbi:MAG: PEP-CTERM sorting domain-containing protein, partial [Deltaproteobacteria bacterium]|nr:PEP-CTERM sorting domain-containing protein [Deltaproteobacteria bacterium]